VPLPEPRHLPRRKGTALGRAGEPAEIAEVVAFLASSRAGYVTGAIVDARGGVPALG
jgi:NAD(P)-dependent dehydrogenase (short-subunit alcohol dehydrogenase family)